jgi:hypothetical protein
MAGAGVGADTDNMDTTTGTGLGLAADVSKLTIGQLNTTINATTNTNMNLNMNANMNANVRKAEVEAKTHTGTDNSDSVPVNLFRMHWSDLQYHRYRLTAAAATRAGKYKFEVWAISLFTLYWSGGILSCFMWSGALDLQL